MTRHKVLFLDGVLIPITPRKLQVSSVIENISTKIIQILILYYILYIQNATRPIYRIICVIAKK